MHYQYIVSLRRNIGKSLDLINIILFGFSILVFLYSQIRAEHLNYFILIAAVVLLVGVVLNLRSARVPGRIVRYKYLLLIAGLGWLGMPYMQWLSLGFLLLAILEYQAKYPLEIGITGDRVVINTLIKQQYEWSAFNNIILRDGLLTLDFKNNKLIQKEVLDDGDDEDVDEQEFNDYCQERLREAAKVLWNSSAPASKEK